MILYALIYFAIQGIFDMKGFRTLVTSSASTKQIKTSVVIFSPNEDLLLLIVTSSTSLKDKHTAC